MSVNGTNESEDRRDRFKEYYEKDELTPYVYGPAAVVIVRERALGESVKSGKRSGRDVSLLGIPFAMAWKRSRGSFGGSARFNRFKCDDLTRDKGNVSGFRRAIICIDDVHSTGGRLRAGMKDGEAASEMEISVLNWVRL